MIYFQDERIKLLHGHVLDELKTIPDQSIHCVVTSPPYYNLRDYEEENQIGLESTYQEYIAKMVEVFGEVRRVLRDDGCCWINIGDTYASQSGDTGVKPKDLIGIPWRFAFACQSDGWHLRQDIIWHKPNPMPESVRDRCTKAHEYVFLLTKSQRYFFDYEANRDKAVREPHPMQASADAIASKSIGPMYRGEVNTQFSDPERIWAADGMANRRSVWEIQTEPNRFAHFACMPTELARRCLLAGAPKHVCDKCGAPYEKPEMRPIMQTVKLSTNPVRRREDSLG